MIENNKIFGVYDKTRVLVVVMTISVILKKSQTQKKN